MNLKEYVERRGLRLADIAEITKLTYPGLDRYLLAKTSHPEHYGIQLLPHAEQIIEEFFGVNPVLAPKARRADRRRLPKRVSCRLSAPAYEALQRLMTRDGYGTTQELISHLVHTYIEGRHNDATAAS